MADKTIDALDTLPVNDRIEDGDLFVMQHNNAAISVSGKRLTEYIDRNVIGITVTYVDTEEEEDAQYIPDDTPDQDVPAGVEKGRLYLWIKRGDTVTDVTSSEPVDDVKTITIEFSSGRSGQFTIKNGRGIVSVTKNRDYYNLDNQKIRTTYDMNMSDGTTISEAFEVAHGTPGIGLVNTVNQVEPNPYTHNVQLTAADVGAIAENTTIPIDHGGTSATTVHGARSALGIDNNFLKVGTFTYEVTTNVSYFNITYYPDSSFDHMSYVSLLHVEMAGNIAPFQITSSTANNCTIYSSNGQNFPKTIDEQHRVIFTAYVLYMKNESYD